LSAADPSSNWTPELRQAHSANAAGFFNSLLGTVESHSLKFDPRIDEHQIFKGRAKMLGKEIPASVLGFATEVIE